jgi:hypothetical protein
MSSFGKDARILPVKGWVAAKCTGLATNSNKKEL